MDRTGCGDVDQAPSELTPRPCLINDVPLSDAGTAYEAAIAFLTVIADVY